MPWLENIRMTIGMNSDLNVAYSLDTIGVQLGYDKMANLRRVGWFVGFMEIIG